MMTITAAAVLRKRLGHAGELRGLDGLDATLASAVSPLDLPTPAT